MLTLAIITAILFWVFLLLGLYRRSSRFVVEKRIERIKTSDEQTTEEVLSKSFMQRVVLPLGEGVAKLARGFTPAEMADRVHKRLMMAGLYPRVTASQLLGLSWISMFACLILVLLLMSVRGEVGNGMWYRSTTNLICLLISVLGGYMLPQIVLSKRVRARQDEIRLTLPYAIDILSISVEAGMGFDSGVGYTMRKLKGPLAEEFAKTLNEIRLGKPRLEALEDLGNRTGVDELKTFITAVVHASRLGGSITNTLRIQADSMRVRRRQRAQEQAMKAPIKIVFPLVLFIFPALFVVILGPAIPSLRQLLLE